jgi:hypothetical protein
MIAKACLGISAVVVALKVLSWSLNMPLALSRAALSFFLFGLLGMGLVEVFNWVDRKIPTPISSPEAASSQAPSKPDTLSDATKQAERPVTPNEKPPTLSDLFAKDFPNTMKATDAAVGIEWKDGSVLHIKRQLYLDFPAKTQFVGFYVPSSIPSSLNKSFEAGIKLAEAVRQAIDDIPKKVDVGGGYRGEMTNIKDLTFSGRVLLYHEDFLSIPQKAAIINVYAAKHFDVQFRGPDYLGDQVIAWHHQHEKTVH